MQLQTDPPPVLPTGFLEEWRKLDEAAGKATPFELLQAYRSTRGLWTIVIAVGRRKRSRCALNRDSVVDCARHIHGVVYGVHP